MYFFDLCLRGELFSMNRINKVLLLLTASAGVSFALLNAQDVSQASTQVSQSKISTAAPLPNNRLDLKADAPVVAAQNDDSGTIGDGVTWSVTDGTLYISGGTLTKNPADPSLALYPWRGRSDITKISITGNLHLVGPSAQHIFSRMSNLKTIEGLGNVDTSKATTLYQMFYDSKSLESINLSTFDTSNVTNMAEMFSGASKLTSVNLSSFNTSNVTRVRLKTI